MEQRFLSEFCERGLVSSERMAAIDANARSHGVTGLQLMESAGRALAERVQAYGPGTVLILCGKGNNGGDGCVAARYLQDVADVTVLYPAEGMKTQDAAANLAALSGCAVRTVPIRCAGDVGRAAPLFARADVILDALLGTGAAGSLREPLRECIDYANGSPAKIIAADMPTPGLRADCIVAFHRPKVPGSEIAAIGIPLAAECYAGPGDLLLLPAKDAAAHKGDGGEVLVIGGGPYQGAPYLAGLAALRAGADIVRVATPAPLPYPDLITEVFSGDHFGPEHAERLEELARRADVVVCGPGLGKKSGMVAASVGLSARRAVFDADALSSPPVRARDTIVTPHAGEFERMFGTALPADLTERARLIRSRAEGMTLLVKGRVDIISDGARVRFNATGAPAMTAGGTGDVLAGIAGALFYRLPAFEAAVAAAYVNGLAGMEVAAEKGDGLAASDLLDRIPAKLLRKERTDGRIHAY
ncbi:MAG: NAD(P)H-hydrate dehydratase [Methanomicrobiales archaeon]|nr:NAD(P)H-hydrate dehydratase [Methanomicrobiales archaeon]